MAARFADNGWSKGLINIKTRKWNGEVRLAEHKLTDPLKWRQPSTVFVNSMSDLFHEKFTNEQIAAVFGVMAACPQHTFQILTKRAQRMREWFEWMKNALPLKDSTFDPRAAACWDFAKIEIRKTGAAIDSSVWDSEFVERAHLIPWPLPNVWLGVSVEDQDAADERIPELLRTPAVIRFLSCEPLIGRVDLDAVQMPGERDGLRFGSLRHLETRFGEAPCFIDWVICGCESGPDRRPCDVGWIRAIRDQCAVAKVPMFLKQARETSDGCIAPRTAPAEIIQATGFDPWHGVTRYTDTVIAGPGSKQKTGGIVELPYLDGVQHAAFPEVAHA